jgi:hypothetical protein
MKFHAGRFKNPQYIPTVDKLHIINWVLFTGGMRLGCEADNLHIYAWQVKNSWSYTSTLSYVSQDEYLTKRSDKFITQEYTYFRCFRNVNARKLTLMGEIVELSHVLRWK